MTSGNDILERLRQADVTVISGVPCSTLGGLFAAALGTHSPRYISAANEGDAVAVAAGAWLAGGMGAVFMQNSGLGNAINPLTTLVTPFEIAMRLFIGWRAAPGVRDEPQHRLMGAITENLLLDCGVQSRRWFNVTEDDFSSGRIAYLFKEGEIESSGPFCVEYKDTRPTGVRLDLESAGSASVRKDFVAFAGELAGGEIPVIATTGYCGRELYAMGDAENFFYQAGSMGCASSIGLGIAVETKGPVIVLDGDGAALMRLGALASIGASAPDGFVHILIDNKAHESTGCQPVAGQGIDFAGIAAAIGYPAVATCNRAEDLPKILAWARNRDGPLFIHASAALGTTSPLPRPHKPLPEQALRFRTWMRERTS